MLFNSVKVLVFSLGVLGAFFSSTVAFSKTIRSTTFNMKWYGLSLEGGKKDFRTSWFREYLEPYFKSEKIIHFQEVRDVTHFLKDIVQGKMKCQADKPSDLVVCVHKSWDFLPYAGDEDFIIEEASLGEGGLRSALHGLVVDSKKKPLFHFIGVHLKAFPKYSEVREKQIRAIASYLKSASSAIPVIMSGDYNSFSSEMTQRSSDDVDLFESALTSVGLKRVELKKGATFINTRHRSTLDHHFVSESVQVEEVTVPSLCKDGFPTDGHRFENIRYYNYFISDHCPLSAVFKIKI